MYYLASSSVQFDWNNFRLSDSKSSLVMTKKDIEFHSDTPLAAANDLPAVSEECTQACMASLSRSLSNLSGLLQSSSQKCCPLHTKWQTNNIPPGALLSTDIAPKQTSCEIEVDVLAADILNR